MIIPTTNSKRQKRTRPMYPETPSTDTAQPAVPGGAPAAGMWLRTVPVAEMCHREVVAPLHSWNRCQRVVLVIASGLGIQTFARWVLYMEPGGGWFNFAPQTGASFPGLSDVRRFSPGTTTILTIVFIVAWAALSVWLLREHRRDD